jgi:hypothetical protein
MMEKRMARCGVLVQLVLIIVMVTCVARAQVERTGATAPAATTTSPATTTTSPTTVRRDRREPVLSRVGEVQAWNDRRVRVEDRRRRPADDTHITQRLVEVSPEKVVVDVEARIDVPGIPNPPQPQKQTKTFLPGVPKSEALRSLRPPGAVGDPIDAAAETVHAAGKEIACTVTEFPGHNGTGEGKAKAWRSPQIPGGMVKMESASPVMKVELVVTKVEEK